LKKQHSTLQNQRIWEVSDNIY